MTTLVPEPGDGVLVQGITGRQASFWTGRMREVGTSVVAGVSPGRGGQKVDGVPVYDSVAEALDHHEVAWSVLFTPALATRAAATEAIDAGVRRLVLLAEFVPRRDTLRILEVARTNGAVVYGPNTAGLVVPGVCSLGIMPAFDPEVFQPGPVGVVSRSGSLGTLSCLELVRGGLGQSAFLGVGGDGVVGTTTREALTALTRAPRTEIAVVIGEVGGTMEEDAAEAVPALGIPVVAFIAGRTAPPGRRMGHAGAIVSGGRGSADGKVAALRAAGATVVDTPSELPGAVRRALIDRARS
jgi:succinyl-CoA synthetase alpha subunit